MLFQLITQTPALEPSRPPGMFGFFLCTGFVGPLLLLLGLVAAVMAVRRLLELRPAAMAPASLQRLLEQAVRHGQPDQAFAQASASGTALGDLVAAGLRLRAEGLDEMLANTERAMVRESLHRQARAIALARIGTTILLHALFGTVTGLMSMMSVLGAMKQPLVSDFVIGIGESLASTAIGLLLALACYWTAGMVSGRVVTTLVRVRQIAEELLVEAARPR
jgi:biopolymer transport protein ExbB